MKKVHIRNNPNWVHYLMIIAIGIFTYGIYALLNSQWLNLFLLMLTLFLSCLFIYSRNVLIKISEKNILVQFKIIGIVYRKISFVYDNILYDSTPPIEEKLVLLNENSEKLVFLLDEDLEKEEKYLLCLEIEHNLKKYTIGNRENAKKKFFEIKEILLKLRNDLML